MIKKNSIRRIMAVFMAACLVTGCTFMPVISAYAQGTPDVQSVLEVSEDDEEYGRGYSAVEDDSIQPPDMLNVDEDGEVATDAAINYPSYYRTEKLPAVRNQGRYGTCWAFSTISLLEINLLKKNLVSEDIDLSEMHLVNFTYNNVPDPLGGTVGDTTTFFRNKYTLTQKGGDMRMAFNSLMDWEGTVDEKTVPYTADIANIINTTGLSDELAYKDTKVHLQDYYKINMSNRTDIKQAVTYNGAVGIAYYAYGGSASNKYYNSDTAAYYCYDTGVKTNHAVTIVGWDDNYSKDNFQKKPSGNGAWIVRNSWGENFGDGGYFYLSYYDCSIYMEGYAVNAQLSDNYDNNYQYDGTGWFASVFRSTSINRSKYSNVFTAKSEEKYETIDAVSFEVSYGAGVSYKIYIYTDLDDITNPESGVFATVQSGCVSFDGAYTVQLDNPVKIKSGTTFSVVVELTGIKNYGPVIVEDVSYTGDWFLCQTSALENQSFWYDSYFRQWKDAGKISNSNFRIKAYTNNIEAVHVEDILLDRTEVTLDEAETIQLNATVLPQDADDNKVYFTSDNEAVAKVDDNGLVTGVQAGDAVITAATADGNKTAVCKVVVERRLKDIQIINAPSELEVGTDTQLGIKYTPDNTTQSKAIEWITSDSDVAQVSSTGLVTAKKPGIVTITAISEVSGLKAEVTLKIISHIKDVTISGPKGTLYTDMDYTFTAEVIPDDTTDDKIVSWSVSDDNIAQITQDGILSFKRSGTVDVIAAVNSPFAGKIVKKITVTGVKRIIHVSSVELDKSYVTVEKGNTIKLNATVLPANADNKEVIYTSSDSMVAKVDDTGLITATGLGEAVITVTTKDGNKTAQCKVKVLEKVINLTGIQITNSVSELERGAKLQLGVKYIPDNTTQSKDIEWKSSDSGVAEVSNTGLITAKKTGKVTITAVSKATLKSSAVTIDIVSHIKDVTISGPSDTIYTNRNYNFTAKIIPEDTTDNTTVIWSVSDEDMAKISQDGTFTFKKVGTVDIIATVKATATKTLVKKITVTGIRHPINVGKVELDRKSAQLYIGETVKLNATVNPANADNREVIYTSSDSAVASVDNNGRVTAVSVGEAVITVITKDGNKTAQCKVTVTKKKIPLEVKVTSKLSNGYYIFTANATGGEKEYLYKFIVYNRTTKNWGLVQQYSYKNTCTWSVSSASAGVREFYIDVIDGNGDYVRSKALTITVNTMITPKPVISCSYPTDEITSGNSITLRASGGDATCTYKFIVYNKRTDQWGLIKDFSKSTAVQWYAGYVGDREFYVDIKDSYGKVTRSKPFKLKVVLPVKICLKQNSYTKVHTMQAKVTGPQENLFKFIVYNKTTNKWGLIQDYSDKDTITWKAGSVGDRIFYVDIKDDFGYIQRTRLVAINIKKL